MILPIGEWVLAQCGVELVASGGPPVAVNLSARQVARRDLIRTISQVAR